MVWLCACLVVVLFWDGWPVTVRTLLVSIATRYPESRTKKATTYPRPMEWSATKVEEYNLRSAARVTLVSVQLDSRSKSISKLQPSIFLRNLT